MSDLWPIRLLEAAQRTDIWPVDGRPSDVPESGTFADGLAEGRRTVEAEFAAERDALVQLAEALDHLSPPATGALAAMIVAAVERLVVDIAGTVPVDAALLRERAQALAALIGSEVGAVLVTNPADCALLDDSRLVVRVTGDAALPRGTIQLRVGDAVTEDGVAAALDRLHNEFERMGLAQ